MIGTLILGLIAGAVAPYAEPHVRRAIEGLTLAETPLSAAELRALALAVSLLVAAILANLLANGGAISLTLGGVLGVFAPRLLQRFQGGD